MSLPETLRLDAPRLHACQEAYQRLLVMTACLLLLRQHATQVRASRGVRGSGVGSRRW